MHRMRMVCTKWVSKHFCFCNMYAFSVLKVQTYTRASTALYRNRCKTVLTKCVKLLSYVFQTKQYRRWVSVTKYLHCTKCVTVTFKTFARALYLRVKAIIVKEFHGFLQSLQEKAKRCVLICQDPFHPHIQILNHPPPKHTHSTAQTPVQSRTLRKIKHGTRNNSK
jgi:hypothetical protein